MVLGPVVLLAQCHRVVVMRQGIVRGKERKAMEFLGPARQFDSLSLFEPAHKKVRRVIARIYVASPNKQLRALLCRTVIISRNTESDSHADGIGKQPSAFSKNSDYWLIFD